jgi:diaminopimelate decarboxylase
MGFAASIRGREKRNKSMVWWENQFLKVKKQRLYLGGTAASTIAKEFGTPLFVYSRAQILANYRRLAEAFAGQTNMNRRICYAMKANPNRRILKILKAAGAWIDAVSPGEVKEAIAAGFPPEKILFTGTSVSVEDLRQAFALNGLIVNVDAIEQLDIMKQVLSHWFSNKKIRVSVRWNPGIGCGFNPKVMTAGKKSLNGIPIKFGVEETKVLPAFKKAAEFGFIPVGFHQHLGSGWAKEDFPIVARAVDKMIRKAVELEKEGFPLEFLDFGGGFGPRYTKEQEAFSVDRYAQYICRQIQKSGLHVKAIAVEPGKFLVADAGVLLLRVEYIKESYGNLFACVNGGTFNTLPRPAIYAEVHHEIVNCSRVNARGQARITVAGNLCETGDVFDKEIALPVPEPGDILAVLCAGAYARSMASNFNLRPIPREIVI